MRHTSLLVALSLCLGGAAEATTVLAGPGGGPVVVLEGAPAERCAEWAANFQARELARVSGLSGLPAQKAADWAARRSGKAAALCPRLTLSGRSDWAPGTDLAEPELGLPPGFFAAVGITEDDRRVWRKAAGDGPNTILLATPKNEAFLKDRARSSCGPDPGDLRAEGRWTWCRPAVPDFEAPLRYAQHFLLRAGLVALVVLALAGLTVLFAAGRARRAKS